MSYLATKADTELCFTDSAAEKADSAGRQLSA